MAIDRDEVLKIARLAYLELPRVHKDGAWHEPDERLIDDAAADKLAADLNEILGYASQLDALDLEGVPPTSHGVPLPTRYRDDTRQQSLATERALQDAPSRVGDGFAVPKVVE